MITTRTPLPGPRTTRSPSTIAADIRKHMPHTGSTWIYCRPYVDAMDHLLTWDDKCGVEPGAEIGLRFLCNAGAWRGQDAKRLKDEIRRALKGEAS